MSKTIEEQAELIRLKVQEMQNGIRSSDLDNELKEKTLETSVKQAQANLISTSLENQIKQWNIDIQPEMLLKLHAEIDNIINSIKLSNTAMRFEVEKYGIDTKLRIMGLDLGKAGLNVEQQKVMMSFINKAIGVAGN